MPNMTNSTLGWRKSSFSVNGDCVEVALQGDSVLVRDSKNPDSGAISFPRSVWRDFIEVIKGSDEHIAD